MLLTLVENAGQILSKDEIIESVWPGQVVTDTALSKQILRLRKLLGDNNPEQPLIETHRGVGYRFTADVDIQPITQQNSPGKPVYKHSRAGYALLAFLLLAVLLYTQAINKPPKDEDTYLTAGIPISLAIVPTASTKDWLNTGGLNYLTELIGQNQFIHSIRPDAQWYSSDSPEELAISLTTNKNIDYSCLIKLTEFENGYSATIKLRTENDILASTEIESKTLPELFEKTYKWLSLNLTVRDQLDTTNNNWSATTDQYALQSYLQGLYETEISGDKKNALSYFQAAVNKDDEFLSAWIKLAAAHLDLGDFDKAISIANTQLGKPNNTTPQEASIDLHYIKAMAYYRLRDDELSVQSIQLSVDSINNSNDPYLKLTGLKSLTFLANMKNDWQQAEAYTLENLRLSKEYYPLPNHLAGLNLALARIKLLADQATEAREYLSDAIKFYKDTGNNNGMISSMCILNRLNHENNLLDDGVQVATTAEPYFQKSTELHEQACFILATSAILNLRGYFNRSQRYIDRMKQIGQETGNEFYPFLAEALSIHMLYVQNKFDQAMKSVEIMRASIIGKSKLPSVRYAFYVLDIQISSRAGTVADAARKTDDYLQKFPILKDHFYVEIIRSQAHVAVRSGQLEEGLKLLKEAEDVYRERMDITSANYVGYEILEVLLQHPQLKYQDTIDRLEANTDYDYLFFKLKSQFKAREGKYLEAVMLMEENKLKANQLWKPEDQLLLEQYQLASN